MTLNIQQAAASVLGTAEPKDKIALAQSVANKWRQGHYTFPKSDNACFAPIRPARPQRPDLKRPGDVPRRRLNSQEGRVALLHAVAHIEFNAVDLAFDLIARFASTSLINDKDRPAFISDWINVGDDEARHFNLIQTRLKQMNAEYGDLPAHDGLWSAAHSTSHDLMARLAIAPMVLEARGLDVTPDMVARLRNVGDNQSADILNIIYTEEISHVKAGQHWFATLCNQDGVDPEAQFQHLVRCYFSGNLKRPFNVHARDLAGMPQDWYEPLAEITE